MNDASSGWLSTAAATLLPWARQAGLVADAREERRLAAMRLEVLAASALPRGDAQDVALAAQWAAFICWLDDQIGRRDLGSVPGELERFTAPLRHVLARDGEGATAANGRAVVLAWLWERTAAGMPARWRERLAADCTDFLSTCEEGVAVRRAGVRLPLADHNRLRRRTITLLPMLDILERTGHADLVEDPRVDSRLWDLRWAVADVADWANDLASQSDDAAAGQDNLVTLVARRDGISTALACRRVAAMLDERRANFAATAATLRATPDLAEHEVVGLRRYVDLVETFMTATLHWLAVTGRFTPEPAPPGSAAALTASSARDPRSTIENGTP